ncbi:ABC-2 transporter permease [Salicibibacter cibarius]|uniref:ABC-2 transporter permease n=1 Tax=Salicibibacter cibarius TaxID=2743000 RepID=A0A7T7CAI0_9BACI|nr:ABC-2 transporter permease [Salicibibacter cibarius]QQK74883.1 ABC-2 transporter permease [Salicibibacter cibarius]
MKGLLLNQYYSVSTSFRNYVLLGVAIAAILIFSQNEFMQSFAEVLITIFIVTPALEVLKHESKSGWNKFVLTLPIKRAHVVQSHFLFFFMAMLSGLLVTTTMFVLADLVLGDVFTPLTMLSILNGGGIALLLGIVAYPLTYRWGAEKADTVLMLGVFVAVGLFLLSNWLYIEFIEEAFQGINHTLVFTAGFFVITLVLYIVSYGIALQVYKRKEF